MLDIKLIREEPDFVRQRLATRGAGDEKLVDEIVKTDEKRRKILAKLESLKAQRNSVSKEIGALMGRKKIEEAEAKKTETRNLGDEIATYEELLSAPDAERERLMLQLPNLPHDSVKVGKTAGDNPVVRVHGEKAVFTFKARSHVELCESLKLVDFERATKLSGSGFILYTNWGAQLERALIQFLLDLHISQHGYTEVSPPLMVGPQCFEGVGQFPKFRDQYYGVAEGDDKEKLGKLYLIPTAETPVANIHRGEILAEKQLPVRYCAYTPCFRGEAGAAGVGTRGMIRVHQFDKVELIKIVKPEYSYDELEKMVGVADVVFVIQ
ncbi:MAG: serine--tRNA ligase [Limisphaerales bacterium]